MMQITKTVVGGMPLHNLVLTGLLAFSIIMMIIATAVPLMTGDVGGGKVSVTMFKYTNTHPGEGGEDVTTTTSISDYQCKAVGSRLQGAGAMCIICIFVSVAATGAAVLFLLKRDVPVINFKVTPFIIAVLSFVCAGLCTLAWILQANAYDTAFESSDECKQIGALKTYLKLGGSFGLLVFMMLYYIAVGVGMIFLNGSTTQPDDKKYVDFNSNAAIA